MKGANACITSLPPEVFMLIVDWLLPEPGERQKRVDAADFACLRLACRRVRELCDASLRRVDLHDRNTAEMRHLLRRFTGAEVLALRPSCSFGAMQLGALEHLTVLRSLQLPFSGNVLSFRGLSALTQLTSFATDYAGNVQRALLYDQLRHLTGLRELDAPMVLQTEGLTVLTALSRLSRLVLEGDGFGVAELAMQLPALERLDLVLTLAGDMPDPEMAQVLGRLPQLAGLSEFALQAGPMRGLLRNLRLPQSIKATTFLQIGTAAATESGEDVAHLLALLPGLRCVGIGGEWAASPAAWAGIVPALSVCQDLRFSGPLGEEAGKQLKPLGPQLTALSLKGAAASSATVGAAKALFGTLQRCKDLDLKGCIHLDGRIFTSLASTAATLTALNCEDIGTVTDDHLAALKALSRLSSLRLVRGKTGNASVNITPAGVASLGALTALRNLKFDLAREHELSDEQLVQLSKLRLTSLSLPPLTPAAGHGMASLHGSNTLLRELSIRGRAASELLMPSLVGFVNLTSLRLRPRNCAKFLKGWQLRSMVPANSQGTGCRLLRRLAISSIDVDDDNLAGGLANMPHLQDLQLLNVDLATGAFLSSTSPTLMRLTLDRLLRFKTVSLLHVRHLTALTELRLRTTYAAVSDAAACILAPVLPPNLVTLELSADKNFSQRADVNSRLTDEGLAVLASPDLGPCRLQQLVLGGQRHVTGRGVRCLTADRFPDLEELVLDDTQVDDGALVALAPLAATLEFVSVCSVQLPTCVSQAGVDAALAAFADRGGAPEIKT